MTIEGKPADVCRCGHTRREHYDFPVVECGRCPCVDPVYTDYEEIFRNDRLWTRNKETANG